MYDDVMLIYRLAIHFWQRVEHRGRPRHDDEQHDADRFYDRSKRI